jgi:nucleotide-binding universal stress UspA family protein
VTNLTHILVGTDFSDPSERAVRTAAEWAKAYGARVTLVHALAVPELSEDELAQPIPEHAELEQAVHEHLDRIAHERLADVDARIALLRVRSASEGITRMANEGGVDLIVVATHGRTGLSRLLLGSVAEQIVKLAKCPVLTVRAEAG